MKYIVQETMKTIRAGILKDIIFEEGDPNDKLVLPAEVDGCRIITVYNFPSKTRVEITARMNDFDLIIEEGIQRMFQDFSNSNIKSVSIPSSLVTINSHLCFQCKKLETVTIADDSHIKDIEACAFRGCKNLTEFNFPASVTRINAMAFAESGIESVVFPEESELTCIAHEAFQHCHKMVYADLSHTKLEKISNDAFAYNTALKKVLFPKTIKEFEARAFYGADLSETSLIECEFLTSIEEEAFRDTRLTDGHMPANLQYIADGAFFSSSIKVLTINPTLKKIGKSAFSHTPVERIENTKYLNNVKVESYAFFNCRFEEITIPNCEWKDEKEIFSENSRLKIVKIENDVKEIPRGMFKGCRNLERVEFPPKLRYIRKSAFLINNIHELDFSRCDYLTIDEDAFNDKPTGYRIKMSPYANIKDSTLLKYTESLF